jgi:hypothetical protein
MGLVVGTCGSTRSAPNPGSLELLEDTTENQVVDEHTVKKNKFHQSRCCGSGGSGSRRRRQATIDNSVSGCGKNKVHLRKCRNLSHECTDYQKPLELGRWSISPPQHLLQLRWKVWCGGGGKGTGPILSLASWSWSTWATNVRTNGFQEIIWAM